MLGKFALAILLLGALASAQTSPTGSPLVTTGRHPLADIFNGGFAFVNTSTLVNGVWTNTGVGKIGNIIYAPAYPGALYGTMAVAYGHVFNSSALCIDILNDFSSYTGMYRVFPGNGTVQHYPEVNSNPISGHTQAGTIAQRFVYRTDDDNTIFLGQDPSSALLVWTRNFRFPAPAGEQCAAHVTLAVVPVQPLRAYPRSNQDDTATDISAGPITRLYLQTYEVYVHNQGDLPLESVNVNFNFGSGVNLGSVVGFQGNFFDLVTFSPNTDGSYTYSYAPHDPSALEEPLSLPIFQVSVTSTSPLYAGSVSANIAPASVNCYTSYNSEN